MSMLFDRKILSFLLEFNFNNNKLIMILLRNNENQF